MNDNDVRVCWDKIGFGDYSILQDREQFSYGIDAVLLADFAANFINEKKKSTEGIAVDLGTGTGVIPLILAHKTRLDKIIGLDNEKYFVKLAKKSAVKNGLIKEYFMGFVMSGRTKALILQMLQNSEIMKC